MKFIKKYYPEFSKEKFLIEFGVTKNRLDARRVSRVQTKRFMRAKSPRRMSMMNNLFAILILMTSGCMEGLPPETPDANPTPMVDASVSTSDATTATSDAALPMAPTLDLTAAPTTIVVGGSSTLNWTSANTTSCSVNGVGGLPTNGMVVVNPTTTMKFGATCTGPGGSVSRWVTVTVTPATCVADSGCSDGLGWTGDACSSGTCFHWPTNCGGMQVRPSATAVTCQFWSGFGTPEPAPSLGTFNPGSLAVGTAGGDWKASPVNACSVKCYNSAGAEVALDIQIEWNGVAFLHQLITGLHKGTFDGHNTY